MTNRRSIRVICAIRVSFFISHRFHRFHIFLFAPLYHFLFIIFHLAKRYCYPLVTHPLQSLHLQYFYTHPKFSGRYTHE